MRTIAKQVTSGINEEIKNLEKDIKTTLNENETEEKDTLTKAGILQTQLEGLTSSKYAASGQTVKVNNTIHGETVCKQWTSSFKEHTPRDDIIYTLRDPRKTVQPYVIESKKMAEVARNHHHNLIRDGISEDENEDERSAKIDKVLDLVKEDQKLPEKEKQYLEKQLLYEDIIKAMRRSKNGKSTGINSIPYEFWKLINAIHTKNTKERPNEASFNIVPALLQVYNDIQTYGVMNDTNFAAGWMCPLYKKKDKREIENYSPITLMN